MANIFQGNGALNNSLAKENQIQLLFSPNGHPRGHPLGHPRGHPVGTHINIINSLLWSLVLDMAFGSRGVGKVTQIAFILLLQSLSCHLLFSLLIAAQFSLLFRLSGSPISQFVNPSNDPAEFLVCPIQNQFEFKWGGREFKTDSVLVTSSKFCNTKWIIV